VATLRLFAQAREAAGTRSAEVDGASVEEVLAAARAQFGDAFGAVLDGSKVWLNGAPADALDPVSATDEVAVLPPVSGG
jgi:molybdopterin synthase sulfur carrier subunit